MLLWPVYLAHRVAGSWLLLVALLWVLLSLLLWVLPRLVQVRPQLAPVQQVAQVQVLKPLEVQVQSLLLVGPRPQQKAQALPVQLLLVLVKQPVLVNLAPMKPLQQAEHQG